MTRATPDPDGARGEADPLEPSGPEPSEDHPASTQRRPARVQRHDAAVSAHDPRRALNEARGGVVAMTAVLRVLRERLEQPSQGEHRAQCLHEADLLLRSAARVDAALGRVEQPRRLGPASVKLDADPLDGASAAIQAVRRQIRAAAASPSTTVLIEGESGTGKQLVARAIHAASIRRAAPYVEVDCTTVAAGLAESELFGHERGAFTGAAQRKLGLIETADGGSLLLDEVGELELAIQAKLLRLLQERTVRRVGGTHDRAVDVRILASTNRTLAREVAEGRFRNDLYYRLRVFVVTMPPLRERGDDVILLANKFVAEFGRALGKPDTRLTPAAVAALRRYSFPGNIRELRAVVEQAVVRAEGSQVDADLLFLPRRGSDPPKSMLRRGRPREVITPDEAQHIRRVMVAHFGNQSKAAAELGISRFTLKRKLLQMQEQPADPESAERR